MARPAHIPGHREYFEAFTREYRPLVRFVRSNDVTRKMCFVSWRDPDSDTIYIGYSITHPSDTQRYDKFLGFRKAVANRRKIQEVSPDVIWNNRPHNKMGIEEVTDFQLFYQQAYERAKSYFHL
jgi:hypothetical protein